MKQLASLQKHSDDLLLKLKAEQKTAKQLRLEISFHELKLVLEKSSNIKSAAVLAPQDVKRKKLGFP